MAFPRKCHEWPESANGDKWDFAVIRAGSAEWRLLPNPVVQSLTPAQYYTGYRRLKGKTTQIPTFIYGLRLIDRSARLSSKPDRW